MKRWNYRFFWSLCPRMSTETKIRVGLLLVSVALSALAGLAMAHGLHAGFLDGNGTGPHT
jgi:hypothetical protein